MKWTAFTTQPDLLGESPFWHPHEKALYWVDIPGKQLRRCDASGAKVESWAMPSEPGCIAPARRGGLVIALRDGVYRAPAWGAALTLLASVDHDTVTTRFNDGKCDRLGRFWPGSMVELRDKRLGKLYCLDMRAGRAPRLQLMLDDNIIANGLDWSPDGRTMYWANAADQVVRAWDWDAQANRLSGQRVFIRFEDPALGRPDGATVDSQGNYWIAMFEGGRLLQFSPAGKLLADLSIPAQCPTMPCFGGDDLRTIYVTSASHGRPAAELATQPLAGCVFSTRVEVPGLPVNFFED